VLCLLVTWRMIIALARSTTEPLNTLAKGIKRFAAGDMETYIDIRSGDEVEEISGVFNDMVDSIHKQMEDNLRKESEKRESQFRFLLAQIRPHFIYNCLNCIIYLARSGKNEDVITFTRSFIDILQASIKTQRLKEAPLTNEIEYLTKYILLIKYRYENTLEFTWNIDESCYGIRLPSLVLLPIVENSIFHGILPKKVLGHIFVTVTRQNGHIRTCIKDDGVGMTPGKLEQVRALLQKEDCESEEKNKHIGLTNVNERLKLCFGNDSMLHIDSQEGTGTEVWFYIKE
jgi:two-component system sensor histidine kinase YesM